jgi:2'-hydroxyisoflavone reductase
MKVLILGGTQFLGRHLVETALALGYEVTIFNRGKSNPNLFPEVEKLVGDREKRELDSLKGRIWDCVIDTIGFQETLDQMVKESVDFLKDKTKYYAFISSISAYFEVNPNFDESTPTLLDVEKTPENYYGVNKARAEKIVTDAFGSQGLNVRAGLIVGKYEMSNRLTYWIKRIEHGGEVLTPVGPEYPLQLIDALDISRWIFKMINLKQGGNFNVTGPDHEINLGQLFDICKEITNSDANFTWIPNEFLQRHNVGEWREMPFWTTNQQLLIMTSRCNISKAINSGLEFRPIVETVTDVFEWLKEAPENYGYEFAKGLDPKKEKKLLKKWKEEIK